MKQVDTLIRDIYTLLETKEIPKGVNLEKECEAFGKEMGELLLAQMQPEVGGRGLRLSGIGKPDRQIYNGYHHVGPQQHDGPTYIKFLYGHVVEAMVLALTTISGHRVRDNQKTVEVEGVKGHIDGYIDDVLMDVKSCSSYGFKKFKNNTLHVDDPFGYVGQLRSYAYAEGQDTYGWLALDKSTGQLAWLQYDEKNSENMPYHDAIQWSVPDRVNHLKKMVGSDVLPAQCYEPVPEGKSGNMRLAMGCAFCDFKQKCFPQLVTYAYATGPKYLTKVVREPRVTAIKIPEGF